MPIKVGAGSITMPYKKAYVGNNIVYSSSTPTPTPRTITYYGIAPVMSNKRAGGDARAFKGYGVFAGGFKALWDCNDSVDLYDATLTKSSAPALDTARYELQGATTGNYLLFGGGSARNTKYSTVDAYDSTFTKVNVSALSTARTAHGSLSIGNYALFCGGEPQLSSVEAYDNTLTKTIATSLPKAPWQFGQNGTSIGNYAILAGGYAQSGRITDVVTYNTSLTRSTAQSLSTGTSGLASSSTDTYAMFGGGATSSGKSKKVHAYNSSLIQSTTELSVGTEWGMSASVRDYVVFASGEPATAVAQSVDNSLTMTVLTSLSNSKGHAQACSIGDYLLFAGGCTGWNGTYYDNVDVYKVS